MFPCDLGDAGVFAQPVTVMTGLSEGGDPFAIADINGDGLEDIAVTSDGLLSVLFGKTDGSFGPPVSSQIQGTPEDLNSALIGQPRALAFLEETNGWIYSFRIASGTGEADAPTLAAVCNQFGDMGHTESADLNGDGIPDLLCAGASITVFLGLVDGGFSLGDELDALGNEPSRRILGDFNEDGFPDIVGLVNGLHVYLNDGHGSFINQVTTVTQTPDSLRWVIGDLNGDGHLDLLVEDEDNVSNPTWVFLGRGDGTFSTGTSVEIPFSFPLALSDLNGDGRLDFVGGSQGGSQTFFLALGNGDGTFQPVTPLMGDPDEAVVADMNGDGKPDLIVDSYYTSQIEIFFNACR